MTCPFYAGGDPGAAFDSLMVQLETTPRMVETGDGTRTVGQHAVLDAVDVTLSNPLRWPQLASALAAARDGDGGPVLALSDQRNERQPDGQYAPGAEAFLAVSCLDFTLPRDAGTYEALAAKAMNVAPRLGAFYVTWVLPCIYWPAEATPAPHTPVAAGAPPILVVGATYHTQDAYQWSVDMASQLSSGVLLTREGTGHPSYFHSACVEDAVNVYLRDLTLPEPGLVCDSSGGLFERMT
jgi:hypothetical protein